MLIRRQEQEIAFVLVFLNNIGFNSTYEVGWETALATILVDERTGLRHLQTVARPVVGVLRVVNAALCVEQGIDVGTSAGQIHLVAADYPLEVLLVAVQSESFGIAVHSAVLAILFGKVVLVVLDGVP